MAGKTLEEGEIVRLTEDNGPLRKDQLVVVIAYSKLTHLFTIRNLSDQLHQVGENHFNRDTYEHIDLISLWTVESSGGDTMYSVRLYGTGARGRTDGGRVITCTCPGYRFLARCKHLYMVDSRRGELKI